MPDPAPIEVHKALADDTRYRLYRYLRLSGRPVSVRELSTRLSLHPNTLRPHLRRLEDVGLVASETQRGSASVGRPQTMYSALDRDEPRGSRLQAAGRHPGRPAHDHAPARTSRRARAGLGRLPRSGGACRKPGARRPAGPNLAVLQEALADAGFQPRFRRRSARTPSTSPCGTAPSAICSTSIANWCARCTEACSRAC